MDHVHLSITERGTINKMQINMEPKETETNIYQEFAITSTHDVFYKTQEQSLKCFQKRNLQNEQGMKAEKETFPFNFNIR